MAYGLPNVSLLGVPPLPVPGHAGLGLRAAHRGDAPAILAHLVGLDPADRRMRFCATLGDGAVARHVAGIWERPALVLAGFDGPLLDMPLLTAGPIRAVAELALGRGEAELGLSVDTALRRRGVGTALVLAAASQLAPRGIRRIVAYTLPDNVAFLTLARSLGGAIETGRGEAEIVFDTAALQRDYLRRRVGAAFRLAV